MFYGIFTSTPNVGADVGSHTKFNPTRELADRQLCFYICLSPASDTCALCIFQFRIVRSQSRYVEVVTESDLRMAIFPSTRVRFDGNGQDRYWSNVWPDILCGTCCILEKK